MLKLRYIATLLALGLSAPAFADPNPAARPGDESLTCAQIGAELMPSAMAMAGAFGGMDGVKATLNARAAAGQAEFAERQAFAAGCLAANTAAQLATLGMANNPACVAGQAAYDARDTARQPELAAEAAQINKSVGATMANVDAAAGQLDMARMEYLSELAEARGCTDE